MIMDDDRHRQTEILFIHHPRLRAVQRKMDRCVEWSTGAREPYCLLVVGQTGVGKTTLITDYVARNPREITPEATVIPVLSAGIPAPATMKAMATELLTKLGDPMAQRGTLSQQTWRLRRLLEFCQVKLIVLDEFNHFIDRDSDKVLRSVADWLKVLIDTTGIPMVLVGTLNSRSVLDANEQLRRRFGTHERLDPFRWDEEGESQFRRFLKELDGRLPLPERSALADGDMAFRFFAASRGTIAGVMKIVRKATHLAIDHNLPRLELPLLARVFAEDVLDEDTPNPFLDTPLPSLSGPPPRQQRAVSRRLQGDRQSAMPSFSAS
jgi:hypothetical protein